MRLGPGSSPPRLWPQLDGPLSRRLLLPAALLLTLQSGPPGLATKQDPAENLAETREAQGGPVSPPIQKALDKLNAGDLAGAIIELETLEDSSDLSAQGKALLGGLYVDAGRAVEAVSLMEPLAAGDEAGPLLLFELARAYLALDRPLDAEASLTRAVERAPYSRAALLLAALNEERGEYSKAARLLEPLATGAAAESIELRDPRLAAEIALRYARALIEIHQEQAAIGHLRTATRLSPSDERAWQLLGETLTGQDQLEEAYQALAEAQKIREHQRVSSLEDAKKARLLVQRASELRSQGQRDQALESLQEAIELSPQDPLPRTLEVRLLIEMRRDREALEAAENLVRITDGAAEALHLRGMSKLGLRDLVGAEEDFRRVLEKASEHRAAMNALALTLMTKGEMQEAEEILRRVIELWPDDSVAAENLERIRTGQ